MKGRPDLTHALSVGLDPYAAQLPRLADAGLQIGQPIDQCTVEGARGYLPPALASLVSAGDLLDHRLR